MRLYLKIIFSNIKTNFGQFISTVLIVAIGTGCFAGMQSAGFNLNNAFCDTLSNYNAMDIQLVSDYGFYDGVEDDLYGIDKVSQVNKCYINDTSIRIKQGALYNARFTSIQENTESINNLKLTEGRMPQTNDEVVVCCRNTCTDDLYLGQQIEIKQTNGAPSVYKTKEFKIVGFVECPMYLSSVYIGTSFVGEGQINLAIFCNKDVFATDYFKDNCIFVKANTPSFEQEEEYYSVIDSIKQDISKLNGSKLESCLTLDRRDVFSINGVLSEGEKIDNLTYTFSCIFIVVSIFVVFGLFIRRVNKQKNLCGILYGLGLSSNRQIILQMIELLIASILGCILGIAVLAYLIPYVFISMYSMAYFISADNILYQVELCLLVAIVCVFALNIVGALVCWKILNVEAVDLLKENALSSNKKTHSISQFKNRRKICSNMITLSSVRYSLQFPFRTVMAIVGIMGCACLVMGAIHIYQSSIKIVPAQYNEIFKENVRVEIAKSDYETTKNQLDAALKQHSSVEDFAFVKYQQRYVQVDDFYKSLDFVCFDNLADNEKFRNLKDYFHDEQINVNNQSAIITSRIAQVLDLSSGDTVSTLSGDQLFNNTQSTKLNITDVTTNYLWNYIYCGRDVFEKQCGNDYGIMVYVDFKGDKSSFESFASEMYKINGVNRCVYYPDETEFYQSLSQATIVLGLVMSVLAIILLFLVFYTLSIINLFEYKHTIAIIDMLGASEFTVQTFVNRSNILYSSVGVVLGVVCGYYYSVFLIKLMEGVEIMYDTTPALSTIIFSVAISYIFLFFVILGLMFISNRGDSNTILKGND